MCKKNWISIDETTDSCDRYVAKVIVGILYCDRDFEPFIVNTVILEAANNATISEILENSSYLCAVVLHYFQLQDALPGYQSPTGSTEHT